MSNCNADKILGYTHTNKSGITTNINIDKYITILLINWKKHPNQLPNNLQQNTQIQLIQVWCCIRGVLLIGWVLIRYWLLSIWLHQKRRDRDYRNLRHRLIRLSICLLRRMRRFITSIGARITILCMWSRYVWIPSLWDVRLLWEMVNQLWKIIRYRSDRSYR